MAGVDEVGPPGAQVDAQQLSGGVAVVVGGQCPVGQACLFGQVGSRAAGSAQGAHQDGGGQGCADVVSHRVGHRHVQGVPVQRVVEGVAAEVLGGLQVAAQGELRCLAGQGRGQQLVLDLRCQRGRPGAFAPRVEIGEAPVGDHDVGQDVGGLPHRLEGVLAGSCGQEQLQQADGVAPVRDRHDHPLAAVRRLLIETLCTDHLLVDAAEHRDPLRFPPSLDRSGGGQPRHCPSRQVHDEEGDPRRLKPPPQVLRDHIHSVDGRRRLCRRQQPGKSALSTTHGSSPFTRPSSQLGTTNNSGNLYPVTVSEGKARPHARVSSPRALRPLSAWGVAADRFEADGLHDPLAGALSAARANTSRHTGHRCGITSRPRTNRPKRRSARSHPDGLHALGPNWRRTPVRASLAKTLRYPHSRDF